MSNKIMTQYDEIMGGKPARTRHLAGTIPTACRNRSAKPSATSGLLSTLLLLLLMVLGGANEVWGQTSGLYFIANNNDKTPFYNSSTPSTNYYMVPASNGGNGSVAISRWAWNDNAATPFVTTYKTNKDNNSIWVIKESETSGEYYLIHVLTGKYMTRNAGVGNNSNRRAFHMEDPSPLGNDHLFNFTTHSGTPNFYSIKPKNLSTGHCYLNPSKGNKDYYYADDNMEGGYNIGGLIGTFNKNAASDNGSKWYLESAPKLPAPTIVYDTDNDKFTISYDIIPAGFTILYTTDGSNPEIGGSTTQTYTNESVITLSSIGSNPLKAVVVRYGMILTETASIKSPNNPTITPTIGDCRNTVTITSDEGTTVYYTIDGTDPTNSSSNYMGSFVVSSDATIKAIAYSGNLHSGVTTLNYSPSYSDKPTIIQNGATITITGTGSIYYTTNGNDPTTGSTPYTVPFTLTGNSGDVITVKAVAKDGSKGLSCVVEKTVTIARYISNLDELEEMSSHPSDICILSADINASGLTASISGFTGVFDGAYHTISGLTKPLFTNLNGGTVKNVAFSGVNITSGDNVGAVCDEAGGTTKIYNCGVLSGTISGSDNVGGLVGHIKSGSSVRVINCYNFATVSGGTTMAGIVGKNDGSVGSVRIAMCMMYGDMNGTSPVYAGNHTNNVSNFTEYNYWRSKASLTYTDYNDQMAIDKDEYLTRFPFYRHILNTHRELAAFFLFGESGEDVNNITPDEISEIGHWVLNKDVAPYPIVEEWKTNTKRTTEDIKNNLPNTTEKGAGKLLNNIGDDGYYSGDGTKIIAMGSSGYLTVNVTIGSNNYSVNLPITDMNEDNYDYTWGKVVLPFANEFSGWTRDYDYVCTGWEITYIFGGTMGTFANYNVSDRDCTAKDLYSNNNYIFAQGGNYIVPYGVSSININAHFAKAFYLSDPTYEVGYNTTYSTATSLGGKVYNSDEPLYHGKKVYTNLRTLVADLASTTNPHDQAIVLVGNYHFNTTILGVTTSDGANTTAFDLDKAVTIMSTDEDNNQEPDYGWYTCNVNGRINIPPLRFDFVPNIEMGMSSRVGSGMYPGIGIWHSRGWFELTETCVSNMSQCEINSRKFTNGDNGKGNNRWIVNSGCFVQIVRCRKGNCSKLSYIQIGGNAYVKELYPGSHTDDANTTTSVPINVTGGQISECYMTGYKAGATLTGNMIYFWGGGGKIDKFLGAYLENPSTAGVKAKVDHALIGRFFGGGTSASARIKGNIDVTINNSQVDFYCGGPEFGDVGVANNQGIITNYGTVTTHATGTTFGEFYGAGYGGTSITYNREGQTQTLDITSSDTKVYDLNFNLYTNNRLVKKDYGLGNCYKFEYIFNSNGTNGVTRFYTGYAQFSLATTGNVTNVLKNCNIQKLSALNSVTKVESSGDFYGAGCQGMVNGTVTSTLTDCTVDGSVFGGGYQASANEVKVYKTNPPTYSVYTKETGIFSDFKYEPNEEAFYNIFKWEQGTNEKQNTADDCNSNGEGGILYTSKDINMSDLGNVTGNITLTIDGGSTIGSTTAGGALVQGTGNVYGGGNESKSLANTIVNLQGNTTVLGNVFGGGNKAEVAGSATVNIRVAEPTP